MDLARSLSSAACGWSRSPRRTTRRRSPRAGGPKPFYLRLGFRPTGERSGGQTVGVLDLGRPGLAR
ncbi:hypothetical protein E1165_22675 [Micromonospora sp. KC723]|nr:hypothetical protein E1165_22675 [Micromonospora sp. KC723]